MKLPRSLEESTSRHSGSFSLDDPRPISERARYTFFMPPAEFIASVLPDDWVKAIFRAVPPDREYDAERMWVKVHEVSPSGFSGVLDTMPSDMPQLEPGAALFIPREFVIDVDWAEGRTPPISPPRREYWERCMVDNCVLYGRSRVDYLYREVPDLTSEGDKYPDSGWRIRGIEPEIESDLAAGKSAQYVALGAVLNEDDRWFDLLDEPAGEAFQWWDEESRFVRLDPE